MSFEILQIKPITENHMLTLKLNLEDGWAKFTTHVIAIRGLMQT
jgi:hypothetical protein